MKRRNFLKAALAVSLLPLFSYSLIKVIKPIWTKKYLWEIPKTTFSIPKATTSISLPKSLKRVYLTMLDKARFVDLDDPESVKEAEKLFDLPIIVTNKGPKYGITATLDTEIEGSIEAVQFQHLPPKKGMQLVLARDFST